MRKAAAADGRGHQRFACGALPVREWTLTAGEMGGVVGGQGNVGAVGGQTDYDAYRAYKQVTNGLDPYHDVLKKTNEVAAWGIAPVGTGTDSTATSGLKALQESRSTWQELVGRLGNVWEDLFPAPEADLALALHNARLMIH